MTERELRIEIHPDEWAEFAGTSAQLVAEGLIPEGFEWPRANTSRHWEANGFSYWLRRTRPDGHKGPMRSWLEMDNWFIRIEVTGRGYHWHTRRQLERKAEELRAEHYRHTAAGSCEWNERWNRYWRAHTDKDFIEFKAKVPGLIPPKRGRKPKERALPAAQLAA